MAPRLLTIASLMVFGFGCVAPVDGSDPNAGGPGIGGKADGDEEAAAPDVETVAAEPPALAPAFQIRFDSTIERQRGDGSVETYVASFRGWASVRQEGSTAHFVVHACSTTLPRISDRQPVLRDSTVRSALAVPVEGYLVQDEEGQWRLASDTAALTLGVRLEHPVDDELPNDRYDPRVVDADEDEAPGVSMSVSVFSIYVGLRVKFWLEGVLDASGGISGEPELGLDFAIYGDSVPFFDAREEAAKSLGSATGLSHHDRLVMTPLATATPSCQ